MSRRPQSPEPDPPAGAQSFIDLFVTLESQKKLMQADIVRKFWMERGA